MLVKVTKSEKSAEFVVLNANSKGEYFLYIMSAWQLQLPRESWPKLQTTHKKSQPELIELKGALFGRS